MRCRKIKSICHVAILAAAISSCAETHSNGAGVEFFEKKIQPILIDHCHSCHSHDAEKIKGGLLLDSREGLLKGGDSGVAIVPGDAEKSLLIKAVRYADDNLQMPPKGKKLSVEQIADLEAWVKMGAPDPRVANANALVSIETIREKAGKHWAFQPIRQPQLPTVSNSRWVQSSIDYFILAKLEASAMKPSPRADKRTLIRRAYFDLIGLPPSPKEVETFVADKTADAFEKVLDRLLASPRYGERWGRYWLDVARYADTKGYVFEEERRYPYAYTYRDYVIRAFNEDVPFDRFIVEQVAADMLPLGEDKRPLAALGFLTLGRRFLNNIHDIIDDRIDVVSRGTMGLTVACARCHDHKYDPIPTKDYYSLYGVFASCREPDDKPLLATTAQGKAYEEYLAERERRVQEKKNFRAKKEADLLNEFRKDTSQYLLAAYEAQFPPNKADLDKFAREKKLEPNILQRWVGKLDELRKATNAVFAPWFEFTALGNEDFAQKASSLCESFVHQTNLNGVVARTFLTNAPASVTNVAETYGKIFGRVNRRWNELTRPPTNSTEVFTPPVALPDPAQEELRQVLYAAGAPPNLTSAELEDLFDVPTGQRLRELQRKIEELDATHPGAPPRAMALLEKDTPQDAHVLIRGNPVSKSEQVPRQFLEILTGTSRQPFTNGSGRLELARAIASRKNPLTARVLVNRVWLHHFGAGLVRTPGDFGLRSDPPTHPELLDYLAARFMDEGWSLKKLHRLIMLSSTYQQASEIVPAYAKADPNNSFLWRMNRRRLDFEAMRDALLAVAENLDLTAGGHATDLTTVPFSTRRTIYGFVDRQNLPGLFRTFDFASPDTTSPQRFATTVPQQALFLMNSPFVIQQAQRLVERQEFKQCLRDEERIRFLYENTFQRAPDRDEIQIAKNFFAGGPRKSVISEDKNPWRYGFGEYDAPARNVKSFQELKHFTGDKWQVSDKMPDEKRGWILLDANGGHPGNDSAHATIRRWIAPRDATISIAGTLRHPAAQGDGIQAWIVSSRIGELASWIAQNGGAETSVERVEVEKGDTIDFIVGCRAAPSYDTFQWSPTIKLIASEKGSLQTWSARDQFSGPQQAPKPLTAWEKFAQVLLLSNEFFFVD